MSPITKPTTPRTAETILGIDPGKTGAIAILRPNDTVELHTLRTDATGRWMCFPSIVEPIHRVMVEDVGCSPQFGTKGNWGLAYALGQIVQWVSHWHADKPIDFVRPQVWKKHFRIDLQGKATSDRRKAAAVEKAKQLFPGVQFATHDQTEALLIAEYARRMR